MEFGARPLFSDVTFVIDERDRVALVGKNGAGKSTLLKILSGQLRPTGGEVSITHDAEIGYLPQVMKLSDTCTVTEEAEKAFTSLARLKTRVESLSNALAERTDYDSPEYMALVEEFTHESERYSLMGGDNYHALTERTLLGLGFERTDFDRPTSEFSGGWRMRIELAKILLRKPDILLLDEPTNHLDIESIQWLENFLRQEKCAVLLVSHDRAFLNNVTTRTMEISCGKITDYRVGYDEYVSLRAERREQQIRAYRNQQKEIADIKEFIERFRYKPTKAIQVQSRIKQLEKIVPIEIDEVDNSSLHLKFPPCKRSGDFPLICKDVRKAYGDHVVFSDVNLSIRRGEKVAFVGRNGEGKSTLVKCIMGQILFDGELKVGHNVEIGYYAQNQAQLLDENITVRDTVDRAAHGEIRSRINDILGAFMFGGEASDKYVRYLSGGERSRLAMISLLMEPVNFLILDEPTNHLDMQTKDVLKEAVLAFDGTAIIVSHDRDFLNGLVTKVYEFGGGKVREHIGGIYDFLESRNIETLGALEKPAAKPEAAAETTEKKSDGRMAYEQQKELARRRRKLEKAASDIEEEVTQLEAAVRMTEDQIAAAESADPKLFSRHQSLSSQLEKAMEEWEKAEAELEQFNKDNPS
jgi:ATP-binding cassette subfamily F protein 3